MNCLGNQVEPRRARRSGVRRGRARGLEAQRWCLGCRLLPHQSPAHSQRVWTDNVTRRTEPCPLSESVDRQRHQTELGSIRSPEDPELLSGRSGVTALLHQLVGQGRRGFSEHRSHLKAETPETATPRGTQPPEAANHGACLLRPGPVTTDEQTWTRSPVPSTRRSGWVTEAAVSHPPSPPPCSGSCSRASS